MIKTGLLRTWLFTFAACAVALLAVRLVLGPSAAGPAALVGFSALIATIFMLGQIRQGR